MLGTGIASAQENVNPDATPSTIDGGITVPIDIEKNALGTPVGQRELPEIHREISTNQLTGANPLVRDVSDRYDSSVFRGNVVQPNAVVPVNICGNAIAAGGNAGVETTCSQSVAQPDAVLTDGSNGSLAGNVVAVGLAVPAQVTGNAIAVLGNAYANTSADQSASTGGDITTSGERSTLSGNIAAVQGALPIQVTNNAVGGGGNAYTDSDASNSAESLGSLKTDGDNSSGGGNVVGVPLAPIAAVNGNGIAGAGNADSVAKNSATADAGTTRTGINGIPSWTQTSGDPATLAGNVVQPQLAGPVSVDDNAVAGAANSTATSSTVNDAEAGGFTSTTGEGSTLSGNLADAPVALPVSGGGNAVSAIGNTAAQHSNDVTAKAGDGTYTNGDDSVLGANTVTAAPAGAVDVCGDAVAGAGNAAALCDNDVTSETGGYNGTTGNDSVGSGNIGQVPVVVPGEVYGAAASIVGTPTSTTEEHKSITSGGTPNSQDDNGTVSSNIVTAPTAVGAQAFGDAAALVGNPNTDTASDTTLTAGGPSNATGHHGSASGNIVQVPTSNPAQVFGDTVVAVGNGSSNVDSTLESTSGGDATSDGAAGAIAGNVVSAPEATALEVFGNAVGAGSNVESDAANHYSSISGGDVTTTGDRGSLSGNGVAAQAAAPVQVFADTVTGAANGYSNTFGDTTVIAGGDSTSSGKDASLAGNLVTVPVNAVPTVFGEPISAAGISKTTSDSTLLSQAGGDTDTTGNGGALTAHDIPVPVEAAAQVYDVPVEVLGEATALVYTNTTQVTGEDADAVRAADVARGVDLPVGVDSLLGATEVPSLTNLNRLPVGSEMLSTLPVNQLPDTDQLSGVELPTQGLDLPAGDLSLPTDELGLPEERSFGGTLPLVGGNFGFTPVVQGLLPLTPAGRSLPTVPAAPVAVPATLPVVVPVVPVAQPRALGTPALPALPTTSLSGLKLDATGDALKAADGERSLPTAPALAGLDTRSLFGNLEDTIQMPRI
ncbi:beta strand repeat-containing protein [Umezawaea tangerina]|nr:hypothetical protein [Umezawaea tangerina]